METNKKIEILLKKMNSNGIAYISLRRFINKKTFLVHTESELRRSAKFQLELSVLETEFKRIERIQNALHKNTKRFISRSFDEMNTRFLMSTQTNK